jgi:single-strand DNA-binding protein
MAGETVITVVGNLTADPELRFTPAGAAVANFTVASTPRTFDRSSGEWRDGEALFLRCNIWRQAAENVAESLQRGMRVVVQGRLRQRSFETKEGEKRTVVEMEVDEIGPSLRFATAKVNRVSRSQGGGGGFAAAAPADDPWSSAAPVRKPKKKVCVFCKDKAAPDIDYKDTTLLRKYISDRGKIRARRVTGNCSQHQRDVATAVKNAREMALLPYTSTAR